MNIKYTFIRKVLWTAKIIFCYFLIAGKLYDVKTRSFYDDLFRSGSSLLGNLLSLHPSTSFYYEPFKKFNIFKDCHHRFNNSEVSNFIEEILGGIFKCEDKILKNKKKSLKCNKTRITVIKTIRIHFNGILPWLHKFPSLKVGTYFLHHDC